MSDAAQPMPQPQGGSSRAAAAVGNAVVAVVDAFGHVAAFILALLTLGIMLGISMRWIGIDNSWTYDFDLFTLVWAAFAGAAYTSLRGRHVTAGIALENVLGRGTLLSFIRLVIVVGFLGLFMISGYWDTLSSFTTHETTIDVDQWPVWVAKAALPAGALGWALAEIAKFLHQLGGVKPVVGEQSLLEE